MIGATGAPCGCPLPRFWKNENATACCWRGRKRRLGLPRLGSVGLGESQVFGPRVGPSGRTLGKQNFRVRGVD